MKLSDISPDVSDERVAFVTGATGFAGPHLVDLLLAETRWQVVGFGRRPAPRQHDRYRHLTGDLLDDASLAAALAEARPDVVLHLAAATPPAPPSTLYATNVGGTATLLDAVATHCPEARVLVVGSDAQYGPLPPEHVPTSERAPMRPVNAYGRSKLLQERVALELRRTLGLHVVCVRPFNHIGPGQSERFVVPSLARQIALADAGLGPSTIQIGRTDTARDFSDVRDVVRAYLHCVLRGREGSVYNVGSGQARRIADVAETLAADTEARVVFESVAGRVRPGDVLVTQCDASRIRRQTGWAPRIPLERTLADIMTSWRAAVRAEARAAQPIQAAQASGTGR